MGSLVRTIGSGVAGLALCAAFATSAPASGTDTDYEGTWNVVPPGHEIVKLEITGSTDGSGAMYVHAFGKCPPAPCDLGTVPLTGLDSVASHPGAPAPDLVGSATFTTGGVGTVKISDYKAVGLNDFITVTSKGASADRLGRLPITVTDSFEKATLRLTHPLLTPTPAPMVRPTSIVLPTASPK